METLFPFSLGSDRGASPATVHQGYGPDGRLSIAETEDSFELHDRKCSAGASRDHS